MCREAAWREVWRDTDKVGDERDKRMRGRLAQWLRRFGAQTAVLICVAAVLGCFAARKEGYHMDELLSFELSNAEFNPWIVPTQPEGRLAKFVREEIRGESFGETLSNLADTARDVLTKRGNSRLLQYRADVYPEPVWISGEQFHDYITVGEEDAFSYLSVYFNVKDDNHPPLHFMLLHTMSSIFRDARGTFQGCVINILAILGCSMCFFGLGTLLERHGILPRGYGRAAGICAALLYGLSAGGIATALLIRMYGCMTFFCVALFYLHAKKWLEKGFARKNGLLIAVTAMGFWTQYFFLFFCLSLAAVTVALLAKRKRYGELRRYIRSMVLAAVIGVGVFPFSIQDVLASGRGTEALQNLGQGFSGYGTRLAAFGGMLVEGSFGSVPFGLAVLACLAAGLLFARWKRRQGLTERVNEVAAGKGGGRRIAAKSAVTESTVIGGAVAARAATTAGRELWLMLLAPYGCYFLLAARMAPYLVDRYIMPLFAFSALLLAVLAARLAVSLLPAPGRSVGRGLLLGAALALGTVNVAGYGGAYLYQGYERQLEVARRYRNLPCVCLYDGVGYYDNLPEFTCYPRTLLLTLPELENRQDMEGLTEGPGIVVLRKPEVPEESALAALERYGLVVEEILLPGEESVHGDTIYLCAFS